MTCTDVEQLQDGFVDAELPAPMLLAVARHAASCAACDETLRALGAMREAVERVVQADAATLDLSGIWSAVAPQVAATERRRTWRGRARMLPAWGALAAMAAGTLFWLQTPAPVPVAEQPRVVARRPNQAVIERLSAANNSRVSLRRDRMKGTTLIMVSADGGGAVR
jgi:anti-sigma factor RsiW